MLLHSEENNALASIEVIKQDMDILALQKYLEDVSTPAQIAFGQRCEEVAVAEMISHFKGERFVYESLCDFYETSTLFVLNHFIQTGSGILYYVNSFENRYRIIKVINLPHF